MFFRPGFNAAVFWCERLSSLLRNATVWNAAWRLNGLVAKALCATHWSGALVSMLLYSRGTVCVKLFCVRRSDPLSSRAWLDVLFVPCLASAAVASPRPVVLLTNQWRSPVAANVPHVPLPNMLHFLAHEFTCLRGTPACVEGESPSRSSSRARSTVSSSGITQRFRSGLDPWM